MDNKNNNFKEFHTVHRLHGFADVSTSFQMCVKKMCALPNSHGLQKMQF